MRTTAWNPRVWRVAVRMPVLSPGLRRAAVRTAAWNPRTWRAAVRMQTLSPGLRRAAVRTAAWNPRAWRAVVRMLVLSPAVRRWMRASRPAWRLTASRWPARRMAVQNRMAMYQIAQEWMRWEQTIQGQMAWNQMRRSRAMRCLGRLQIPVQTAALNLCPSRHRRKWSRHRYQTGVMWHRTL